MSSLPPVSYTCPPTLLYSYLILQTLIRSQSLVLPSPSVRPITLAIPCSCCPSACTYMTMALRPCSLAELRPALRLIFDMRGTSPMREVEFDTYGHEKIHNTAHTRTPSPHAYNNDHRLRCDRPAFRRAASPPCRFMPFVLGCAGMPLDSRHCSRRDPRGPCVDIRVDDSFPAAAPESRSIASVTGREESRMRRRGGYDGHNGRRGDAMVMECI